MPSLVMRNVNIFITLVGVHEMYTHAPYFLQTHGTCCTGIMAHLKCQ